MVNVYYSTFQFFLSMSKTYFLEDDIFLWEMYKTFQWRKSRIKSNKYQSLDALHG